jgi:hypothetical protein
VFTPKTNNFQKPIKFKSDMGNEFFGRRERNQVRSIVKVSENVTPRHVAHIKSLRSNLLSVSQMRVLRSVSRWALLVCWIIEVILYA